MSAGVIARRMPGRPDSQASSPSTVNRACGCGERIDPQRQRASGRLVGRVALGAVDPRPSVQARDARADGLTPRRGHGRRRRAGRGRDGVPDHPIAGATTQDAAERILDRGGIIAFLRWDRRGRHEHARDARAALHRAVREEGRLERVEPPIALESLDRGHLAIRHLRDRDEAGADRLPVQLDRAGAAVPGVAPDLRAGERQVLTEDLRESPHRRRRDRDRAAVDPERDGQAGYGGTTHRPSRARRRRTIVSAASAR